VRFEVLTAAKRMMFLVLAPCRLVGRAEDGNSICFSETLALTNESTWRQNPEEHTQNLWMLSAREQASILIPS
jgi:hypothetical protein